MMKILVTGSTGFFGKSVLNSLANSKREFECICTYKSEKNLSLSEDKRFTWVKVDLLNETECNNLIVKFKPTTCIHLAWYIPPQNFWSALENLTWLSSSVFLFHLFCKNGGKNFLCAGSLAEYGYNSSEVFDEKETPLMPDSLYGQCKKSLYELIHFIRNSEFQDVNIAWARIGYFFGSDEPKEKFMTKLIHNIKYNLPMDLLPSDVKKPYAHIKYAGKAITHAIFSEKKINLAFNLSSSKSYSMAEIVSFISKCLKKEDIKNIKFGSYSTPNFNPDIKVNTNVIKEEVGYYIPDTFFNDLKVMVENKNGKF